MSIFSKRVNISSDILLEYVYDDSNYKSDDYKVLTNLKNNTKSYISNAGLNTEKNSLVVVDPINDKYSPVDVTKFNFLRLQNFPSSLILCDKVKIYFAQSFDFYSDYLGFYINIYTHGYNTDDKYYLSNFFYTKDNPDISQFDIFTLPKPFTYNGTSWVRSIEFDVPSLYNISNQRLVTITQNEPIAGSINYNLSRGEGLSLTSPIFFDFQLISTKIVTLGTPYYILSDLLNISIPQTPEFDEIGVNVQESTQGDYFEIYGLYQGSNENLDNFIYNESIKGNQLELNYIISLYEENILSSSQTIEIVENFSQKILYRPIIQFSNTTASIDVELRIINRVDTSYISKYGSIGITSSINKYGRTLTRLNLDSNTIKTDIFNLKYKNIMGNNNGLNSINGSIISQNTNTSVVTPLNNGNGNNIDVVGSGSNNPLSVVKVPYPVISDKYNIVVKSVNSPGSDGKFVSNGLLDIIITSFDTIINFNIAKDVVGGVSQPLDLSAYMNNSKILLIFKSDTERVDKEVFVDAPNNLEAGSIFFKVLEIDYYQLKKIYDKGFDNFYIVIESLGTTTQLYSGRYVFYEDVLFVDDSVNTTNTQSLLNQLINNYNSTSGTTVTNTTLDSTTNNNASDYNKASVNQSIEPTNSVNMVQQSGATNLTYTNLMLYVRSQTNQDNFNAWLKSNNITPKFNYFSQYFIERIDKSYINIIKNTNLVEKIFEIPLETGSIPEIKGGGV